MEMIVWDDSAFRKLFKNLWTEQKCSFHLRNSSANGAIQSEGERERFREWWNVIIVIAHITSTGATLRLRIFFDSLRSPNLLITCINSNPKHAGACVTPSWRGEASVATDVDDKSHSGIQRELCLHIQHYTMICGALAAQSALIVVYRAFDVRRL